MSTVNRRTLVRAAAVTVCAGTLLGLPAAAALAEGVPAASAAHSAGAPRTLLKTLGLADGVSKANVYRIAEGGFQADILAADGAKAATLTSSDGSAGFGGSGPLHVALRPDGRLSSWVGAAGGTGAGSGTPVADGHKTGTRDGRVVQASAPHARSVASGTLDTLADGPGDGVLLLAAGGGIAAVGAAGLGFAMLRRGRTEG
ncbi:MULTISPECIES: hypothetical protein [unclassified Streptomyces]|uniref:hypothetical protein n=1 Tax=unclassified Streptomyces TaxID=2593676 RepID=UPI00225B68AD|nr:MULTISPECIES: hypothetical protein [unclassified Streptomyces]MCX5145407.1 hypothetical protein [Streptomyces sp. NBC_00320]WSN48712.1 hypothetical protein OG299_13915 [Streptomyces sp. NBC_01296]WSW61882.1 hypothetical protein OG513_26730 [Streptomyces sp. NBC_00998]